MHRINRVKRIPRVFLILRVRWRRPKIVIFRNKAKIQNNQRKAALRHKIIPILVVFIKVNVYLRKTLIEDLPTINYVLLRFLIPILR
jgi:hypothetical protein